MTSTELFCADESGQDLIEYALVGAMLSLCAIVAMKNLATVIGNAYLSVGTKLATNV